MSKKIEYSQDKIIENNSFGNGAFGNKRIWQKIVTKRIPVLECKRNSNHCYVVGAEDRVQ